DAARGQQGRPGPVRAELRPAGAAEREERRARTHRLFGAVVAREGESAGPRPACPATPRAKVDALRGETRKPGAQQRRGFHGLGKDAPARADEGLGAEAIGPGDEIARGE